MQELKNKGAIFVAVFVFAVTFVIVALIISNTKFYIQNQGSSIDNQGSIVNSISVTGDGEVYARPDMANLSITASESSSTSKAALELANTKINQAVEVLRSNGVDSSDIQTSQFSVYPEYEYTTTGSPRITGQRATVSLYVQIKGLDSSAVKLSTILDSTAQIDGIQLGSISFDIENKTDLFSEARELAFNKAKQKAEELAYLAGVSLLKPVSVVDTVYDISPRPVYSGAKEMALDSISSSEVQTGELKVSVNLSVIWGI